MKIKYIRRITLFLIIATVIMHSCAAANLEEELGNALGEKLKSLGESAFDSLKDSAREETQTEVIVGDLALAVERMLIYFSSIQDQLATMLSDNDSTQIDSYIARELQTYITNKGIDTATLSLITDDAQEHAAAAVQVAFTQFAQSGRNLNALSTSQLSTLQRIITQQLTNLIP